MLITTPLVYLSLRGRRSLPKKKRLRERPKKILYFGIEIEAPNQQARDSLLKECEGFEGCPFKVHTTHRQGYKKQLRKVLTAMSTDLKAIDKYLAARAEGGSEVPPASYETTKAIDAVGNNYKDCLSDTDKIALSGLKKDFQDFADVTKKLWNDKGFNIVDSRKKLDAITRRSQYLSDNGVGMKVTNPFGGAKILTGDFESVYSPDHFPHLYEQVQASQSLWIMILNPATQFYLGDNLEVGLVGCSHSPEYLGIKIVSAMTI